MPPTFLEGHVHIRASIGTKGRLTKARASQSRKQGSRETDVGERGDVTRRLAGDDRLLLPRVATSHVDRRLCSPPCVPIRRGQQGRTIRA